MDRVLFVGKQPTLHGNKVIDSIFENMEDIWSYF